jgi:hypothetical protein
MIIVNEPIVFFNNSERKCGISAMMRIKNGEDYLEQSIMSVINQIDEIICVFNHSTDNTENILLNLEIKFPSKIKVYKYVPVVFPPGSNEFYETDEKSFNSLVNYYNFALSKTSYMYVFKLDDDQLYFPKSFENIKQEIKTNTNECYGIKGINLFDHNKKLYINQNNTYTNGYDILLFKYNNTCLFAKSGHCEKFISNLQAKSTTILFYHTKFCKKDRGINNYKIENCTNQHYKKISDSFFNNIKLVEFEIFNKNKYPDPLSIGFKFANNSVKIYNHSMYYNNELKINEKQIKIKSNNNCNIKINKFHAINNINNLKKINTREIVNIMATIIKNINHINALNIQDELKKNADVTNKKMPKPIINIGKFCNIKTTKKQNLKINAKMEPKINAKMEPKINTKIEPKKNQKNADIKHKIINIQSKMSFPDKICIVGNGKSIYEHKMGNIIDGFNCVIRCNIPTFTKNKDHIGKKTDILFSYFNLHYKKILKTSSADSTYASEYIKEYNFIKNSTIILQYDKLQNKNGDETLFHELHKNNIILFLDLQNGVLKYKELYKVIPKITFKSKKEDAWCSTGLLAIMFVLLNNKKPYIYGFDINQGSEYYSVLFENYYNVPHDFEFERKYILELIKYNYVNHLNSAR